MKHRHKTYQRRNALMVFLLFAFALTAMIGRLCYMMIVRADHYGVQAKEIQQRERRFKAKRGEITERCWQETRQCLRFRSFTAR